MMTYSVNAAKEAAQSKLFNRRIVNGNGEYLHMSGEGWSKSDKFAWSGTLKQAQVLALKNPGILGCDMPLVHGADEKRPEVNEVGE